MNPEHDQSLRVFFDAYEKAIQPESRVDLGDFYNVSFLFAGDSGAQPVKLDDFKRVVPKMSADARARGLTSTRLKELTTTILDSKYSLVKIIWDITVEVEGLEPRHLETDSSYLVMQIPGSFRIVCQIDHKDLSKLM